MKPKLIRITTVPMSFGALLKGQPGYMNKHFEVTCVSSGPDNELAEIKEREGVEVARVNMTRQITPLKDLVSLFQLYRFLKKQMPQIVHTHTPKAGLLGMIAARLAGVPVRMHTVAGLPLVEATGNKRKLLNFVEEITYRFATNVYPNSQVLRGFIIENKFCKPVKVKVIANGSSNGVDTERFSTLSVSEEEKTSLKQALGISSRDYIFVFVGRLVSDKGINELVSAFERLQQIHQTTKLLLVGPLEPELDPLKKITSNAIKNSSHIIYAGYQNDVTPYLAISHALVFPTYREGFPNVPMQAGAMGLPSIVTDINGCNEIVIHGETGLIIPPKDEVALFNAMNNFFENQKESMAMGQKAVGVIKSKFEQKYVWQQLLAEYQSLMQDV